MGCYYPSSITGVINKLVGVKMHILILPFQNYLAPESLSGIFQRQQAHPLKRRGIKVGIVSAGFVPFRKLLTPYPYRPFENEAGVMVYRHFIRLIIPGRIANQIYYKRLISLHLHLFVRYLKEQGRPDIIHAHNCLYAGLAALAIKAKYGIPYLVTEHSSAFARNLVSKHQARLVRSVLKNADARTVVSIKFGELLQTRFGAAAAPLTPIFNILDERFEHPQGLLPKPPARGASFTFLNIASLDVKKNQAGLLRAFADAFKGAQAVQLRIGGTGLERQHLIRLAAELGIAEQVCFLGGLDRASVFREMSACDAFVLSSTVETFGVVLIEALACGKPVIATRSGGPEDIVHQDNGVLIPAQNIAALAEAMRELRLNIDKYDAAHIRNDCLARFGQEPFIRRLLNIYQDILDKRRC